MSRSVSSPPWQTRKSTANIAVQVRHAGPVSGSAILSARTLGEALAKVKLIKSKARREAGGLADLKRLATSEEPEERYNETIERLAKAERAAQDKASGVLIR